MSTPASDVLLSDAPIVHTPHLARALPEYRDGMGFDVLQHVTGVLAVLRRGQVHLHLWQRGVSASDYGTFKPGHHRIAVSSAFETHADLLGQSLPLSLSGTPQLQAWGAWEFSLKDSDGNVLHLVQWVVNPAVTPMPAATPLIPLPWPSLRNRRQA